MPFFRSRVLRGALERYAGRLLIEQAEKDPSVLKLGAARKDVSLVYLDIWGFTEITGYASPEAVVELLCDYFSRMTGVIRASNGFVDKFFGDAIFAIFGAPVADANYAFNACTAVLACLRETAKLSAQWHVKGFGKVHQSIGVTTGPAIVGNIGNEERAMFTAVGEAVGLTVQLQQASRLYRAPIIICRDTHAALGGRLVTRELDVIKVQGSERTTTIFELVGTPQETPQQLRMAMDLFERGLRAFRSRDWDRAEKRFADVDKVIGDDGPSRLYLRRCALYRKHPPPPEWDLVHAHTVRLQKGEEPASP
ncbi:MAG: adenylate/guanylate cyclase domain-containing protein [Planctomycetes bacterium]|nr:adenylate/guanylate cyclase domain-containing protein [Planctomycetota bacterium]